MKSTAKALSVALAVLLIGSILSQTVWAKEEGKERSFYDWLVAVIGYFIDEHDQASQAHCFHFDRDCNIGIGTPTPNAPLTIAGFDQDLFNMVNPSGLNRATLRLGFDDSGFLLLNDTTNTTHVFLSASMRSYIRGGVTIGTDSHPYGQFSVTHDGFHHDFIVHSTTGNVGIGTLEPQSALQVEGYTQLGLTSGSPPPADCDHASERGRMMVDSGAGMLWVCVDSGWVSK